MSVYVDTMRPTRKTSSWPFIASCHMVADTQVELFEIAENLGLLDRWFQSHRTLPHYDLTTNKRRQAIQRGAQIKTPKELIQLSRTEEFRRNWNLNPTVAKP